MSHPNIPDTAFVPWIGNNLEDILYEQYSRTVGRDNCVSFERKVLHIPANGYRCNYIKEPIAIWTEHWRSFTGQRSWQIKISRGIADSKANPKPKNNPDSFSTSTVENVDNSFVTKSDSSMCC